MKHSETKSESAEKYRDELWRTPDLFPVEKGTIRSQINAFTLTSAQIQGPLRVETFS